MDEIVPSLRYCAYNLRDNSVDLQSVIGKTQDPGLLDDLIKETREQQSATLQEVEWRGRKMAVKQEKARSFLLRNQDFFSRAELGWRDGRREDRLP